MDLTPAEVRAHLDAALARHPELTYVTATNLPAGRRYHIAGTKIYLDGGLSPNDRAQALLTAIAELDGDNVIPFPVGRVRRRRAVLAWVTAALVGVSALVAVVGPTVSRLPDVVNSDTLDVPDSPDSPVGVRRETVSEPELQPGPGELGAQPGEVIQPGEAVQPQGAQPGEVAQPGKPGAARVRKAPPPGRDSGQGRGPDLRPSAPKGSPPAQHPLPARPRPLSNPPAPKPPRLPPPQTGTGIA